MPLNSSCPVKRIYSLLLLALGLVFTIAWAEQSPKDNSYDVVVLGSEPEGIIAAVAAAQEGAKTLLVTPDPKLGGLFVMGQMNSLDLRTQPELYQRGLFLGWWRRVGKASAFDVAYAERAFEDMLSEAGVEVLLNVDTITPLLDGSQLRGLRLEDKIIDAKQLIDAGADADFAALAGANYSLGFESIGLNARMADTLVFRINGVNWSALKWGIRKRGKAYAEVDNRVAWGHFGGYPAAYRALEPGIRLRGLNLGRQDDGSVLVNALLIYGIDPFDPDSVAEGRARASREAPRIIAYLQQELPGFANASFGGVAPSLYVRETRHIETLCTLTVDDVLDNRVSEQDIAAGGYPLDVQTLSSTDNGYVYGTPEIYGVRLCSTVPQGVDNLWVIGRSAGFDPLAAASARVVPLGMAVAEAVGVAAAQSITLGLNPLSFASEPRQIAALRERLTARGAYLPFTAERKPEGPVEHPYYASYRLLLSRGLALGGYNNDPKLDEPMTALGYLYLLSNVGQRFLDNTQLGPELLKRYGDSNSPLTATMALAISIDALCELDLCLDMDWQELIKYGFAPAGFPPEQTLTRGAMYELAARIASLKTIPVPTVKVGN